MGTSFKTAWLVCWAAMAMAPLHDSVFAQDQTDEIEQLKRKCNEYLAELIAVRQRNEVSRNRLTMLQNEKTETFDIAYMRAKERIGKSGDATEKAALLDVENRQLKQVIAQRSEEYTALLDALHKMARQQADELARLDVSLRSTVRIREQGQAVDLAPDLTKLLQTGDWAAASRAACWLGLLDPPAQSALPALKEKLKDRSGILRALVAQAIWRIEKKTESVLPVLLDLMANDTFAKHTASEVLAEIGRSDPGIVEPVAKLLPNADETTAFASAWALLKMGPKAKAAIPALEAASKDPRPLVRDAAQRALETARP